VLRFFQTPLQYSFDSNSLREWYGFAIGAAFSGVVGVLLPIMGNRVWCRFGCTGRNLEGYNLFQNLKLLH
jgi:hypothetical protein